MDRMPDVDGHLDGTFGHDGRVRTGFAARRCVVADAVAIQSDEQSTSLPGTPGCRGSFALARYLPNGKLEPSFGGDGKVVGDGGGKRYSESFSVVIRPDGKIVAAGLCCGSRFSLRSS